MKSLVLFALLLALSTPALALPAISCHCFRDRSFDPARPAAADPYLLATTRNSFLSAVFGIEKKAIVRARMSGTSGDTLWVEGFVARRGDFPFERVAEARGEAASWKEALEQLHIAPETLGKRFAEAASGGADEGILAEIAADEMLRERFAVSDDELGALRADGAGSREIILAELLSPRLEQPAPEVFAQLDTGTRTWGQLLDRSGLTADALEEAVRRRVAESR